MKSYKIKALGLLVMSLLSTGLIVAEGARQPITQLLFDQLDGNPLVINNPGDYEFTEDVIYRPNIESLNAIQILSDNVSIDLCGFRLIQGNQVPVVGGILIGDDGDSGDLVFKNITIKNGSVLNFTDSGIYALNFAQFLGNGAYENLTFSDLNILECGSDDSGRSASGIDLDSFANFFDDNADVTNPANIAYRNVTIERCKVNKCRGAGAINIYTGENVVITDTEANNLLQRQFALNTIAYTIVALNLQMTNCQGNSTRQEDPSVTTVFAAGILVTDSVGILMKCCQFNETFGESGNAYGVRLSNNRDALYIDCQFNRARGGFLASFLCGVFHEGSGISLSNGNKFVNCQFNGAGFDVDRTGNPSLALIAGFICINTKNLIFEGCQACNISADTSDGLAYGFIVGVESLSGGPELSALRSILFKDTVVSDITARQEALGIALVSIGVNSTGEQTIATNCVVDNCIVERIRGAATNTGYAVAGIADCIFFEGRPVIDPLPPRVNLFIKNSRVSDVKHVPNQQDSEASANSSSQGFARSAGILVESVINPVLCNNSVSDCDRGILLTGTNRILPNKFQLGETPEQAAALDFVDLFEVPLTLSATLPEGGELGPYEAIIAQYSPPLTGVINAPGGLAEPEDLSPQMLACGPLDNPVVDFTGQVGICRRGACAFVTKTTNVEAAGADATVVVSTGNALTMAGAPTGDSPSVMISNSDGNELITAILENPEVIVTIDTFPSASQPQVFANQANGVTVEVSPTAVDPLSNVIAADPVDLNEPRWTTGDPVLYTAPDPENPLPGLESGTTYYAIVYSPGFSECGLIQDNKVDNNIYSGFQDDRCPSTSAFLDNTAFKNCPNYAINWPGKKPVCESRLDNIRKCDRPFNLSINPAKNGK